MKRFIDEIFEKLEKYGITYLKLNIGLLSLGVLLGIIFIANPNESSELLIFISVMLLLVSWGMWTNYLLSYKDKKLQQNMKKIEEVVPPVEYFFSDKPKYRFYFDEETVRSRFTQIAEKHKMHVDIKVEKTEIIGAKPQKCYNIKMHDSNNTFEILIVPAGIDFYREVSAQSYFLFSIYDDYVKKNEIDYDFPDNEKDENIEEFVYETDINMLSDNEILDIVEGLTDVMYDVVKIETEKTPITHSQQKYQAYDYTFYVSTPDNSADTVTIGNFKFIINGGF